MTINNSGDNENNGAILLSDLDEKPAPPSGGEEEKDKTNNKNSDNFQNIDLGIPLSQEKNPKKLAIKPKYNKWLNLSIVFLVLFFSECARGIVVPTINQYSVEVGGDNSFLGWLVSSFSFGRFISTILLGYLSSRLKYKKVFSASVFICSLGALVYCFAYLYDDELGKILLILSRCLLGFGAGTLSVVRAYVAEVSSAQERTTYVAWSSAIQFLGFAITPIIGSVLAHIPWFYIIEPLKVYHLTSPGYFLLIFNIVLFFVILFQFRNPKKEEDPTIVVESDKEQLTKANPEEPKPKPKSIFKVLLSDKQALMSLFVFVILNFFVRGVLGIYETLGTPLFNLLTGDVDDSSSGYYFGGMGIIGIFVLLGISYITKKQLIDDFWILIVGNALMLVGCLVAVTTSLGWARFTISNILIWSIGYPLAQTIIVSMFSKTLSGSIGKASQGTMMGIIGAMGSFGRILGPLISGYIFNGTLNVFYVFLFASILSIITLAVSFLIVPKSIKKSIVSKFNRLVYKVEEINLENSKNYENLV
ncbi:hypothetical protein DICPUDRAFT_47902 [Dictyostelium purpureum]|uniref:Major facilitator superfamily (MFS) profile domain-containing protein n=1 Tax=Dictyostelium purpureum TaxID=5786 RepID=F0ZLU3_DICPU|nr:uncharacterized protein DICPUDRAFT_47902 [Dictyostelium purpureum]EGC35074.1 hypothetical protein DICPUDRAFT_47902 [Dictyostelium purpureum]|eukprot:XP_003288381.1 hypothetical protein DICPUDRAFT_47902 [Dictyostelium purpureum]